MPTITFQLFLLAATAVTSMTSVTALPPLRHLETQGRDRRADTGIPDSQSVHWKLSPSTVLRLSKRQEGSPQWLDGWKILLRLRRDGGTKLPFPRKGLVLQDMDALQRPVSEITSCDKNWVRDQQVHRVLAIMMRLPSRCVFSAGGSTLRHLRHVHTPTPPWVAYPILNRLGVPSPL